MLLFFAPLPQVYDDGSTNPQVSKSPSSPPASLGNVIVRPSVYRVKRQLYRPDEGHLAALPEVRLWFLRALNRRKDAGSVLSVVLSSLSFPRAEDCSIDISDLPSTKENSVTLHSATRLSPGPYIKQAIKPQNCQSIRNCCRWQSRWRLFPVGKVSHAEECNSNSNRPASSSAAVSPSIYQSDPTCTARQHRFCESLEDWKPSKLLQVSGALD